MFTSQNICVCLSMFTFAIYTQQQLHDPAFMNTYHKYEIDCAKEESIDVEMVHKAWNDNHFPNDKSFKCFYKCINLKLGIINEKGDVIDDVLQKVALEFVDTATDKEIITECGAIQGADLCETSLKLTVCFKNATLD